MTWTPRTLAALLLLAAAARADTVTLRNGRTLHGRVVEQTNDRVRLALPGGTITVPRDQVASVAEDDELGEEYGVAPPRAWLTRPPLPQPPPPAEPEGWTWARGVTAERIAALTPARDRLLAELRGLGPAPDERLAAARATDEERRRIGELIDRFTFRRSHVRRRPADEEAGPGQRVGGTLRQRQQARDDVLAFGPKAVEPLRDALRGDAVWRRRMAAQALARLVLEAEEAADAEALRWLMYRADVPGALLPLLDQAGETEAAFLRQDADAALEAITQERIPFVPSAAATPTAEERRAAEAWRRWWDAERPRWRAAEEAKEARRAALVAQLAAVREGRDPSAGAP